MSNLIPEKIELDETSQGDGAEDAPCISRHEYWKMISEQARLAASPLQVEAIATEPEMLPAEDMPQDAAVAEAVADPLPVPPTDDLEPEAAALEAEPAEPPPGPPTFPEHPRRPRRHLRFPRLHFGSPFWTIASILSLTINLVLILVLVLLAREIFGIKNALQNQLINGLYDNFALMDQARIQTTIPIDTSVPAKFDLPLNTVTTVVLQKEVLLKNARVVSLSTGGLTITNAPADIILPAGAQLPVSLNLIVPVDQQIPVKLNVVVDIPLNKTDLHTPFVGLQNVVGPYKQMLDNTPNTLQEAVCGKDGSDLCKWIIP